MSTSIRLAAGASVIALLAGAPAASAQDPCTGTSQAVRIPQSGSTAKVAPIALPSGHRQAGVALASTSGAGFDEVNPTFEVVVAAPAMAWTPTEGDFAKFRELHAANPGREMVLIWRGAAAPSRPCSMRLDFAGAAPLVNSQQQPADSGRVAKSPADASALTVDIGWEEGDCGTAGPRWADDITRERRRNNHARASRFTAIVFHEDQGVCYTNRDYGVVGDPIYVAVFTDEPAAWNGLSASFDPCAAEPAAPSIYAPGTLPTISSGREANIYRLRAYLPRRCFNPTVDITIRSTGTGNDQKAARYNLTQSERFRAGLQLGTTFTNLHDHSFGLRSTGNSNVIFDKGPTRNGPEYFASIVFYSVLRYLPALRSGTDPYPGRDIIHDQGLIDRLGLIMGVGLRNPGDRFVIGGAYEVLPGLNVMGAHEFARVSRLSGVKEGDVFTGAEDKVPVRKRWDRGWTWGISIDLKYATTLLTRP